MSIMSREISEIEPGSEITRISIPDDDMIGWIETLRAGGFGAEEMDSILEHLNDQYFEVKNKKIIDESLREGVGSLEKTIGRKLTQEEIDKLRQLAKKHIRDQGDQVR